MVKIYSYFTVKYIDFAVRMKMILVSLISNDISNICIVVHYLSVKAWFSLVHKTKKAITQSLLSCLSVG